MRYRDRVRITRPAGDVGDGGQDPVTGLPVTTGSEGPEILVYDGPAVVQAGTLMRANRNVTGDLERSAEGTAFLPHRAKDLLLRVEPDDVVGVTYRKVRGRNRVNTYGADATVHFVRPEDNAVLLRYR